MTNLALDLREAAQMYPDRPAVRLDDTILTYAELDDLSARAAGWLRERGLRPGDPVGIMLPNVPQFAVVYYGVLRAGRRRRPDEPAAQGARGRVLPGRLRRQPGLRWHERGRGGRPRAPRGPGPSAVTIGEPRRWPSSRPRVAAPRWPSAPMTTPR